MEKYRQTIIDSEGNIIPLATVNVYDTGTTNSVSIFSDDGVTSESNPFTTGTDAVVKFYAADGRYDIKITKSGFDDILVVDQQLFDLGITGATGGISNTGNTTIEADSDSNATGDILFQIGGVTKVNIKNNGNVQCEADILFRDGFGLDFSAFSSGSSDPNVLDDYEEGTWEIILTPDSGTITENTTANRGYYTKIGRVVHVQGAVIVSSVSSPSGNVTMSLPLVVAGLDEIAEQFGVGVMSDTMTGMTAGSNVIARGSSGAAAVLLFEQTATGPVASGSFFQANSVIHFSFSYITP